MKSVKIHIKKLGAIRDSILEIKPLMVFSGESGLGKSYAAFLVHYLYVLLLGERMHSFFDEKGYDFKRLLKNGKSGQVLFTVSKKELLAWMNKDAVAYVAYLIGYDGLEGEVEFDLPYKGDFFSFTYEDELGGLDKSEEVFYKIKLNGFTYRVLANSLDITDVPFRALLGAALLKDIFGDYLAIRRTFLMPPSRGALMELSERPDFRSGMYEEFFEFKAALNRPLKVPSVLSQELTECLYKVNEGKIQQVQGNLIYETKEGHGMPLTAAASSIKELAPFTLFLNKFSAADSSILLEEPEAHLHPQRQIRVADLIACAVSEGCHLQITTHSDYLIKRLNNLIKLYLLKFNEKKLDELHQLMDRWQISNSYLINPSRVGAYLLERNPDGTSRIVEQDIFSDSEIPFESFYKVIEEDFQLSREIKSLW